MNTRTPLIDEQQTTVTRYGLALVTALAALGLTSLLWPVLRYTPLTLCFAAVTVSAWYGGPGPGLAAAALAAAGYAYVFLPPMSSFSVGDELDLIRLVLFVLVAGLISLLCGRLKRAEEASARQAAALRQIHNDLQDVAHLSAHDLQEQVHTITIYTQLLAHQYGRQLDARAGQYVDHVAAATTHLSLLLQRLRIYLVLDYEEQQQAAVDGEIVWRQTLEKFQDQIIKSAAGVTHDPLPTFQANPARITLVFYHLLENALKFHQPETPPKIHAWAERQRDSWRFAVRDRGIGLAPEYAEVIFGVGKRLHPRDRYPGTGMGLAICKKIIEQRGGRIWVESNLGSGSTFYFTIREKGSQ